MLSRGMKDIGHISISHLQDLILALGNLWIVGGILLLLAFFAAYMTALSWADLTYVLPATSLGYVLLALIAKFVLHEQVSALRWVGIALIAVGVRYQGGRYNADDVEITGLYWHFVDLVWMFVVPLVYLLNLAH